MGCVQVNIERATLLNTVVDKVVIRHVRDKKTFIKRRPTDTKNWHATFTMCKVALYQYLMISICHVPVRDIFTCDVVCDFTDALTITALRSGR